VGTHTKEENGRLWIWEIEGPRRGKCSRRSATPRLRPSGPPPRHVFFSLCRRARLQRPEPGRGLGESRRRPVAGLRKAAEQQWTTLAPVRRAGQGGCRARLARAGSRLMDGCGPPGNSTAAAPTGQAAQQARHTDGPTFGHEGSPARAVRGGGGSTPSLETRGPRSSYG